MNFAPIIDMRSTTIARAFFLNALILAIIAAASIELRRFIEERIETKDLSRSKKMIVTTGGSFIIGIVTYLLIRIVFGYGEGLIGKPPFFKNLV